MKTLKYSVVLCLLVGLLFSSCTKDELAFDVIESPVLAIFEDMDAGGNNLTVKATFFDLDKSGILDNAVGIDSTPVANLEISVFILANQLVETLTTDSNGEVVFDVPFSDLAGASRLEWVGKYDDIDFRIFHNF
ncbi:MAG: hypothetical protein KTR30_12520 [Saprospiraceae bacterium]|nr:hypothetical protein [Saprospiraceae bacterium]